MARSDARTNMQTDLTTLTTDPNAHLLFDLCKLAAISLHLQSLFQLSMATGALICLFNSFHRGTKMKLVKE